MHEEPYHPRRLGWIRAGIGALILLRTTPLLAPLHLWFLNDTVPLLGWPTGGFSAAFLPIWVIQILCILRTLAAALFMLGLWTRASGLLTGALGYLVAAQYPFGFFFTIHLLYESAMLLALTDAGAAFALRPVPVRAPRSSYWLLRLFLASIYAWAGLFKLRPDWLDGRTLELFRQPLALHGALADLLLATPSGRVFAATSVAVFEVAIGPLLVWHRTRRFAWPAAYLFHLVLEITARPDLLGWGMMVLLVCFI
ncbi:MAG TPA: HTTM domain-containing protein [Polyangiaceae bacterium]